MATLAVVVTFLLLHGVSLAHRDAGDTEKGDDIGQSVSSRPTSNHTAGVGKAAAVNNTSVAADAADSNADRFLPTEGASLMQLSATAGVSASLQKTLKECELNSTHKNHDHVSTLQRCANELARLAEETRSERSVSLKANQNYFEDLKLAKTLLKLLEERTASHEQHFEKFKADEDAVLEGMMRKLNVAKHGAQQASLVQSSTAMSPFSQPSRTWSSDARTDAGMGQPMFARRSRLVSASIDAASLGPEVDSVDMQPNAGTLQREAAALESKASLEDDGIRLGAGRSFGEDPFAMSGVRPSSGYGLWAAPLRARDADWY